MPLKIHFVKTNGAERRLVTDCDEICGAKFNEKCGGTSVPSENKFRFKADVYCATETPKSVKTRKSLGKVERIPAAVLIPRQKPHSAFETATWRPFLFDFQFSQLTQIHTSDKQSIKEWHLDRSFLTRDTSIRDSSPRRGISSEARFGRSRSSAECLTFRRKRCSITRVANGTSGDSLITFFSGTLGQRPEFSRF